jgi:hypothetical protein
MSFIQIVLLLFAAAGFAAAVLRYRRGGSSRLQLVLWSLLWAAVVGVALRPSAASYIAARLGVGRGADVVVYLALALLFYLQFRLFGRLEDQERQITKLTREIALRELKDRAK